MNTEELLVGIITCATGLFVLVSALGNSAWYFQLPKPQRLETWMGRPAARGFFVLIGLAVIVLGVAIALGYGPNKSHSAPTSRWQHSGGTAR